MGCGASSEKGRATHSTGRDAETFFPPPPSTSLDPNEPNKSYYPTSPQQNHSTSNGGSLPNHNKHKVSEQRASGKTASSSSNTGSTKAPSSPKRATDIVLEAPKKKAAYVPPAPITGTSVTAVAAPTESHATTISASNNSKNRNPLPHSTSASTLDTKSASKALQKQKNSATAAVSNLNNSYMNNGASLSSTLEQNRSSSNKNHNLNGEDDTVGDESFQPDEIFRTDNNNNHDIDNDDDENGGENFHGSLDLHQSGFDQGAISVITSMTMSSMVKETLSIESLCYEYPTTCPEPSSSSGMRFDELYRLKGVLGTGAFSTVREGFHRNNSNMSFAVKCINRKKLSDEDEAALLDEVSILKELTHDHIIRLFDFFEEPSTYYLIMERMRGGELFDRIVAKAYYNEKEARDTCKIVLEAVRYCHENHVAHRDLKPENLLLLSDMDDSAVKIADFGFAKKVYSQNSLTTQCGTPGYVAPEILEGTAYDERADMWSVGVILYILLGGYPPFIESTQRDLFRKIRKGDYEFHEEYWGTVSTEAKELISSLLTVSCVDRLTAEQALQNPWILGDDAKLASKDLGSNLTKLRNFNAKRKFRAAVSTVMAVNKLNFMGKEFFADLANSATDDS